MEWLSDPFARWVLGALGVIVMALLGIIWRHVSLDIESSRNLKERVAVLENNHQTLREEIRNDIYRLEKKIDKLIDMEIKK